MSNEVLNSINTLHGDCLFLILSLPTESEICNSCFRVVISNDFSLSDKVFFFFHFRNRIPKFCSYMVKLRVGMEWGLVGT